MIKEQIIGGMVIYATYCGIIWCKLTKDPQSFINPGNGSYIFCKAIFIVFSFLRKSSTCRTLKKRDKKRRKL